MLQVAFALLACGERNAANSFLRRDAGSDAADGAVHNAGPEAGTFASDAGTGVRLGGPCRDDGQCADDLDCTVDVCDTSLERCRFIPDHSRCADEVYCNGVEQCDTLSGCRAGAPVTCSDRSVCSIDSCVEEQRSCAYVGRDADGDGDITRVCAGGNDCDDTNPDVSSSLSEVCGNLLDDDCDDQIDEADCVKPKYDLCSAPLDVDASGSYLVSTQATSADYVPECLDEELAAHDVVLNVVVAENNEQDVDIVARAGSASLALLAVENCGDRPRSGCVRSGLAVDGDNAVRLRLRAPVAGQYPVYLYASRSDTVQVEVNFVSPEPVPLNETCGTAAPLTVGEEEQVNLTQSKADVESSCGDELPDQVYQFSLAEPRDVRLYAQSLDGLGEPRITLYEDVCSDGHEITCRRDAATLLFARALPAGTYHVVVGASGPTVVGLTLELADVTEASSDEQCAGAPILETGTPQQITFTNHTDDFQATCFSGAVDAVYALDLTEASDVLVVERLSDGDTGAIQLLANGCVEPQEVSCTSSRFTPVRTRARNLAPGRYHLVAESRRGNPAEVTAFERPAGPPIVVAFADDCESALVVPKTGGYFQGNTANVQADYPAGCDLPSAGNGAADQVLKLELDATKRVILDMASSGYATLLNVRRATDSTVACPEAGELGSEVSGGCSAGFRSDKSYLDLELPQGTYFVQVDGYGGDVGPWFLDVYIVDPIGSEP